MEEAKKERVTKNEQQRLRNVASARLAARGRNATPGAIKSELKKAIQASAPALCASAPEFCSLPCPALLLSLSLARSFNNRLDAARPPRRASLTSPCPARSAFATPASGRR